jgi:hypothetical protein
MRRTYFIVLMFCISFVSKAQFPKSFPDDGLDLPVGISYSFMNNESEQERKVFMGKFTGLLVEKGFNVVSSLEPNMTMSEAEKVNLTKFYDSLKIKYMVYPVNYGMYSTVILMNMLDKKMKRYSDRASFQAALDQFIKDVDNFKASHPNANAVAFEYKSSTVEADTSAANADDDLYENTDFSSQATLIDQLPTDLSAQTLLFLLFDDFDVTPEDSALISAEELAKRKKRILKYKKKNEEFKSSFKEYPYPVKFVYSRDLKELSSKYPYQLVDRYRRETKRVESAFQNSPNQQRFSSAGHNGVYRGGGSSTTSKIVLYHNYCIKDHRKTDTFYRLPEWIDCDKEFQHGCLTKVAKTIRKINEKK